MHMTGEAHWQGPADEEEMEEEMETEDVELERQALRSIGEAWEMQLHVEEEVLRKAPPKLIEASDAEEAEEDEGGSEAEEEEEEIVEEEGTVGVMDA